MRLDLPFRIYERAYGDGNCAFNAFALALTQPHILNQIEEPIQKAGKDIEQELEQFITQCSSAFKTEQTWSSVKAKLIELRCTTDEEAKIQFQTTLAPILRTLFNALAKNNGRYYSSTIPPLLATFEPYASGRSTADDIFLRHAFIKQKFSILKDSYIKLCGQLKSGVLEEPYAGHLKLLREYEQRRKTHIDAHKEEPDDELILKILSLELLEWWKAEGFNIFFETLSKDASAAGSPAFGGDLELAVLGRYFNANVYFTRGLTPTDFLQEIFLKYGNIPGETTIGVRNDLVAAGFVNGIKSFSLQDSEEARAHNVSERTLQDWVSYELTINEYIIPFLILGKSEEDLYSLYGLQRRDQIPDISKQFVMPKSEMLKQLSFIAEPNQSIIRKLIEAHAIELPNILMLHQGGSHWDHVIINHSVAQEIAAKRAPIETKPIPEPAKAADTPAPVETAAPKPIVDTIPAPVAVPVPPPKTIAEPTPAEEKPMPVRPVVTSHSLKSHYEQSYKAMMDCLNHELSNAATEHEKDQIAKIMDAAKVMNAKLHSTASIDDRMKAITDFNAIASERTHSIQLQHTIKTCVIAACAVVLGVLACSLIALTIAGQAAALTVLIGLFVGSVKGSSFLWAVAGGASGVGSGLTALGLFKPDNKNVSLVNSCANSTVEKAKEFARQPDDQKVVALSA